VYGVLRRGLSPRVVYHDIVSVRKNPEKNSFSFFLKKVPGYRIFFKNTVYFYDDPEMAGGYIKDKSVIHSGLLYIIEG